MLLDLSLIYCKDLPRNVIMFNIFNSDFLHKRNITDTLKNTKYPILISVTQHPETSNIYLALLLSTHA